MKRTSQQRQQHQQRQVGGGQCCYRPYRLSIRNNDSEQVVGGCNNNLFVRLPQDEVQPLVHDAEATGTATTAAALSSSTASAAQQDLLRSQTHFRFWSIESATNDSTSNTNIDFLPLEIKFTSRSRRRRTRWKDDDAQRVVVEQQRQRQGQQQEPRQSDHIDNDSMDDEDVISTIYASYNGGNLIMETQDNTATSANPIIEIPSTLIPSPSITAAEEQEQVNVHVRVVPTVVYAQDVTFEPLSVEDWELIDIYSDWLESGGLLQQISMIYTNQILTIELPSSTMTTAATHAAADRANTKTVKVQMKVKQINSGLLKSSSPPSSSSSETVATRSRSASSGSNQNLHGLDEDANSMEWPDVNYSNSDHDGDADDSGSHRPLGSTQEDVNAPSSSTPPTPTSSLLPCALLVQYTEVIVIPKPRRRRKHEKKSQSSYPWSYPLRLIPCMDDYNLTMKHLIKQYQKDYVVLDDEDRSRNGNNNASCIIDVEPQSILIHQTHLESLGGVTANSTELDGKMDDDLLAWVIPYRRKHDDGAEESEIVTTHKNNKVLVRLVTTTNIYLDKFDAALHPLIRFQLGMQDGDDQEKACGLRLFWDSVRVQLVPKSEIDDLIHHNSNQTSFVEQWCLKRIRLSREVRSHPTSLWPSQPWHIPECCAGVTMRSVPDSMNCSLCVDTNNRSHLLLQDGSLITCSVSSLSATASEPNEDGFKGVFKLFRRRQDCDHATSRRQVIAALSPQDLAVLYQKQSELSNGNIVPQDDAMRCIDGIEIIPISDLAITLVPDVLAVLPVSTSVWIDCGFVKDVALDLQHSRAPLTLLNGRKGTGKTYTALLMAALTTLCKPVGRPVLYLDCKRLQQSSLPLSEMIVQVQRLFDQAVLTTRCTIVLDSLDVLIPNLLPSDGISNKAEGSANKVQMASPVALDQSKLFADRFIQLLQASLNRVQGCETLGPFYNVTVIATCESEVSIHPDMLRSGVCECRHVRVPSSLPGEQRVDLLGKMARSSFGADEWARIDQRRLGQLTEGFRPRDLEKLASRIGQLRLAMPTNPTDFVLRALEGFVPLSHMSLADSERNAKVAWTWSDLGGMFRVKNKLTSTVIQPSKYRRIYERAKIRLPRGVLLFGPPGCGKSVIVPALAKECNFPLITCKGPEVLDKYIGASEAKVRELFNRASEVAPSILFLDELDALAPRRGSDHTGVTDRVVNQLLTFLDGVEDSTSSGTVYILAATSRPDKVDPALVRPGRLEQHIFVGPAESQEEWSDLLSKMVTANHYQVDDVVKTSITSNDFAANIRTRFPQTKYFAAADFKAVLDTAHVDAVHDAIAVSGSPEDVNEIVISRDQLELAFASTRPSISGEDARSLQNIYRAFHKTDDIDLFDYNEDSASKLGLGGLHASQTKLKATLR